MTSFFYHPPSLANSPKAQNFLLSLSLVILRASGTTILCLWSYGNGMPSKTFSLPKAADPLGDLWGIIPLMLLHKIRHGALKWTWPLLGLQFLDLFKNSLNLSLFLKRDPDFKIYSHLTTMTLWPLRSSFAILEASLPNKWPLPSTITSFSNILRFLIK